VLVAAARHGLGTSLAPLHPPVVLGEDDVELVRLFCRIDRIVGLLASGMRSGEIAVAAQHAELIMDDWHQGLRACVLVEALLVRVAQQLDRDGIRWALTKGSAVGHLDFPDPGLRLFADVDLVIHQQDWDSVLQSLDRVHEVGPHTRSFTRRYGKGETLQIDDMEVDLHLRFAVGRFGVRSAMEDCFRELDSFVVAERSIPALSADCRLLHACFHATLGGNPGLRAYRDVAQLVSAPPECVATMWESARRWRATAVVATALVSTWEHLQLDPAHPVVIAASEVPIGRSDRRALDVFANNSRFRPQAMTALAALPWHRRPGFLLAAWQMSREALK